MTGKTHVMAGIASTTTVVQFTEYDPLLLITAGVVGALLPDICHSGSKIGRRFRIVSKIINRVFGHRTFTHSILFLFLICIILGKLTSDKSIIVGVAIGMISHYILDAATKKGIQLLYPIKWNIRFPITTRTGSSTEKIIFILLTLIVLYFGKDIVLESIL
ncbi:metal-dependent hydrolase [Gracilibacillus marinus]|uniref:Metal-dependent hydrolase n=1 Tax=Gracilibacillus marinus TaxID=630535 RepID=A0ABV8VRS4_9BACI